MGVCLCKFTEKSDKNEKNKEIIRKRCIKIALRSQFILILFTRREKILPFFHSFVTLV